MTDLKKKWVGVVGMGETGLAVADYLSRQGTRVLAYDKRAFEALPEDERRRWEALEHVEMRTGHEKANVLDGVDHIIVSPGVPGSIVPIERQREKGVPVWSEVELASQCIHAPIMGVTGTNGKSTTVTLLGKLLQAAGWETFVGGNLGPPLITACDSEYEQYVVELSSYQLEETEMFRPHVAILLNISADHLDRYAGVEAYAAAKARMFMRMLPDDIAILNADDPLVQSVAPTVPQVWHWSTQQPVSLGAYADERGLHFVTPAAVFTVLRDDIALKGKHNEENVMAAVLGALTSGVTPGLIREVLRHFKGLPHRVEFVREYRGARYFDDSKGTNLGALSAALSGFTEPVVLIAGGVDKGGDYAEVVDALKEHVRSVVVLGEAAPAIRKAWEKVVPVTAAESMADAVQQAAAQTQVGDVVLLSPACSSFDMFRDYKERGRVFQAAVHALFD